jgi:hypothetical protein
MGRLCREQYTRLFYRGWFWAMYLQLNFRSLHSLRLRGNWGQGGYHVAKLLALFLFFLLPLFGQYVPASTGGSSSSGVTPTASTFASVGSCTTTPFLKLLTDSYYNFALCNGASTLSYFADGKQNFPPTAASTWTVTSVSGGAATAADKNGAVVFSSSTPTITGIETMFKAVPTAPYTKTLKVRYISGNDGSHGVRCGVGWGNGTTTSSSTQSIFQFTSGASQGPTLFVGSNTDYSFGGNVTNATDNSVFAVGNDIWYQLTDDNTNRKFSISTDGEKFVQIYSTARATPFTPTVYGLICTASAIGFAETLISDN